MLGKIWITTSFSFPYALYALCHWFFKSCSLFCQRAFDFFNSLNRIPVFFFSSSSLQFSANFRPFLTAFSCVVLNVCCKINDQETGMVFSVNASSIAIPLLHFFLIWNIQCAIVVLAHSPWLLLFHWLSMNLLAGIFDAVLFFVEQTQKKWQLKLHIDGKFTSVKNCLMMWADCGNGSL